MKKLSVKRLAYAVVILLLMTSPARPQEELSCGRECVKEVKTIIASTAYSKGYQSSWIDKANKRLGDKVAVAVVKIYKKRELYEAKNIRQYLPVIRNAFSLPAMVENEVDRRPTNTLKLLDRLKENVGDKELREEISKTADFIERTTANTEHF